MKRLADRQWPGGSGGVSCSLPLSPDPVTASFVDDELRASCADLLFQVRWRDGESGFVYFLIEHQSTPDRRMPLRLLGYLTQIWERFAAHHPATIGLPEIVPVLIHQGPRAWPWPATFESAKAVRRRSASPRVPAPLAFGFILDDLATLSDRELLGRGEDAIAKLTLFAGLPSARRWRCWRAMFAPSATSRGRSCAGRWPLRCLRKFGVRS